MHMKLNIQMQTKRQKNTKHNVDSCFAGMAVLKIHLKRARLKHLSFIKKLTTIATAYSAEKQNI